MASTNYTTNLQLSSWDENDKPERLDFVNDNIKIDNTVGSHISDTDIHLSADQKAKLEEPFVIETLIGTGEATRTVNLSFTPKMIIVLAGDKYPVGTDQYGTHYFYFGIATQTKCTSGLSLSGNTLTLTQNKNYQPDLGVSLPFFNEGGTRYMLVIFK